MSKAKTDSETKVLTHIEGIINQTTESRLRAGWKKIWDAIEPLIDASSAGEYVKLDDASYDKYWQYGFAASNRAGDGSPHIRGGHIKLVKLAILDYLFKCYVKANESNVRAQVIKEITERLAITSL